MARLVALAASVRRFGADRRAVSAIEFALILPILLLLLMGSFDVTRAIDAKNKTVMLSRTIADFVAQNSSVTTTELANIILASKFVMYPYPDTAAVLTVKIESVNYKDADKKYWVDWSYPPAASTDVVTTIAVPDTSSIRAQVRYVHHLKFTSFLATRIGFSQIVLNSTTHMSPRGGTPVTAEGF